MEFKFRAGDYRPPPCSSTSPTTISGVARHVFLDPCLRRETEVMRKPLDFNEAMHRELEMMRYREEKMMAEIERQRILTAETRRELMMVEREMAIQRAAPMGRLSVYEQWGTPFKTQAQMVVNPFHGWEMEDQFKSHGHQYPHHHHHPHHQQEIGKSEFIVLAKPESESRTVKRKVETPVMMAAEDIHPQGVTKIPKDEWSCALCKVTSSSQINFNQHLQGKKHKSKEAGLRAQNASKNSQAAPAPKKRRKILEAMETLSSVVAKQRYPKVRESLQCETIEDVSNQKTVIPNPNYICLKNEKDEQQISTPCIEDLNVKHKAVMERKSKGDATFVGKKKFKFWCKMCKVGAYFETVMDDHVKGKKHKAQLQELQQLKKTKKAQNK